MHRAVDQMPRMRVYTTSGCSALTTSQTLKDSGNQTLAKIGPKLWSESLILSTDGLRAQPKGNFMKGITPC